MRRRQVDRLLVPEASGNPGHGNGDEVVEVAVGGRGQLQGPEADVVKRLVVDAEGLVAVLDQLVDGQGGVVRLHHRVRDLHGRQNLDIIKESLRHI